LKPWAGYCFNVLKKVSNPWREAIEGLMCGYPATLRMVSNPWREAIEVLIIDSLKNFIQVSNPWREAIEARRRNKCCAG